MGEKEGTKSMGGSRNAVSKRFIYHNFYCSNGTIQTGQSHYESDSERCLSSAKVYLDWPVVGCGLVLSDTDLCSKEAIYPFALGSPPTWF
jgi:hypothetical protein